MPFCISVLLDMSRKKTYVWGVVINRFRHADCIISSLLDIIVFYCMQCSVGVSKRKQKALSVNEIEGAMQKKCCKANCIQMKLSKSEIMKTRTTFRSLTEEAQRSFILNFFLLSQYHHKGKRRYTFRVNGKNVCRLAWMSSNSISPTT